MSRRRVHIPLRWSDMDAYGHVNNVQYLRLLEEARVLSFGAQGAPGGGTLVATGLIVARSEIEYLEPLQFRVAPVAVDYWVTAIGGADFDLGYEVRDPDPEPGANGTEPLVYARAESTQVVFDLASARPRRITPEERAELEELRDEPVPWKRRRRGAPR